MSKIKEISDKIAKDYKKYLKLSKKIKRDSRKKQ